MATEYEAVIGLEVHGQLLSRSKMFCACSTEFGAPPNTHVCPVCLGLPGALPVPNRDAVQMAIRAALALECAVRAKGLSANFRDTQAFNGFRIDSKQGPRVAQNAPRYMGRDVLASALSNHVCFLSSSPFKKIENLTPSCRMRPNHRRRGGQAGALALRRIPSNRSAAFAAASALPALFWHLRGLKIDVNPPGGKRVYFWFI